MFELGTKFAPSSIAANGSTVAVGCEVCSSSAVPCPLLKLNIGHESAAIPVGWQGVNRSGVTGR